VTLVRLNRPQRLNALNNALVSELADALETADRDGACAAVITGDERAFAARADIGELSGPGPELDAWDRLWNVGMPVIELPELTEVGGNVVDRGGVYELAEVLREQGVR